MYIFFFPSNKKNGWKKTNNYLQLLSFVTCIYSYYPNVRLIVISRFYSKVRTILGNTCRTWLISIYFMANLNGKNHCDNNETVKISRKSEK